MEYNDNFVLPPNDILEKMRVDYQKTILKPSVLNTNSLNIDVSPLSQEAIKAITYSYYFLSNLINNTSIFMLKQKLNSIFLKTKENIKQLKTLYPNLDAINEGKPKFIYKRIRELIKELILLEIESIRALISLEQNETSAENKKTINAVLEDRFSILKDIIVL